MRVLITGATGLIGKQITGQCIAQNIQVNYLTTSDKKIKDKPNYKGFLWNSKNNEIDIKCFENVDAIIHLAGASIAKRWTDAHKEAVIKSRINTANLLFNSLQSINHKVRQFISASAIGAYPSSLSKIYTEDFPKYNPGFLGDVVEAWESAADQFKELDIKVAKIRIGVVLAKDDGALPQLVKPIKNYVGSPLGSGKQWQSWIHIEDLAGVFLYCLKQDLEGVYNAAAPSPVTNETMTKEAAKILDKPLWLPNVPEFVLKLILGEMSAIVLESQKVSSEKIQTAGYSFKYVQLHDALQDLL